MAADRSAPAAQKAICQHGGRDGNRESGHERAKQTQLEPESRSPMASISVRRGADVSSVLAPAHQRPRARDLVRLRGRGHASRPPRLSKSSLLSAAVAGRIARLAFRAWCDATNDASSWPCSGCGSAAWASLPLPLPLPPRPPPALPRPQARRPARPRRIPRLPRPRRRPRTARRPCRG